MKGEGVSCHESIGSIQCGMLVTIIEKYYLIGEKYYLISGKYCLISEKYYSISEK